MLELFTTFSMKGRESFILVFAISAFLETTSSSLECSGSFTTQNGASGICNITFGSPFDIPDKRDQLTSTCGPSAPTNLQCNISLLGLTLTWQAPSDASATSLSGFKLEILEITSSGKICYVRCPKKAYFPLNHFMVNCHWKSPPRHRNMDMILSSLPSNLEPGCNDDCFSCSFSNRRITGPSSCSKFTSIGQDYHGINESAHINLPQSTHSPNKNDVNSFVKTVSYSTSMTTTTNAPEPSVNKDAYKFSKSMDYLIAVVIAFLVVSGALGTALVYKFRKESRNSSQGFKKESKKDAEVEQNAHNDQTSYDIEREKHYRNTKDSQVLKDKMRNESHPQSNEDKTYSNMDSNTRLQNSSVHSGRYLPYKKYEDTSVSQHGDSVIGLPSLPYTDHPSFLTNSGHSSYTTSSRCPVHSRVSIEDDMTEIEQGMLEINELYLPPIKSKTIVHHHSQ